MPRPSPTERIRLLEEHIAELERGRTSRQRAAVGIDHCLDKIGMYKAEIGSLKMQIADRARQITDLSGRINDCRLEKERLLRRLDHESVEETKEY